MKDFICQSSCYGIQLYSDAVDELTSDAMRNTFCLTEYKGEKHGIIKIASGFGR